MPQQSSPLLDDYNNTGIISPPLQRALDAVRQKLPQFQGLPGTPSPDAAQPRLQPPGTPVPLITRGTSAPPATVTAPPPTTPTPLTDPNTTRDLNERNRLISTGSGVSQVKNPVARGLLRAADIAGTAFFPNITAQIPGTELHHNVLVKRAEGAVNEDVNRAKENATTAETEARTAAIPGEEALRTAQTAEAKARTKTLENPNDKAEAKTIETDQGIMQWNPQTQRYDIPVGQAPGKQTENTHVLPDGTVVAVHNDPKTGKSTAEVLYQGKPSEKPGHVIQREVGGKLHNILIDAETGKDRMDLGETRQPNAPSNDHGVTMIGKDGKVYRLEPGQTVPEGAQTPTQAGSVNTPTTQQRNVASQAQLVHEQTPYMLSEIDRLKDKLGPMQGRWNEFIQGKVGMQDPDMAGLRADLLMYSSAVALMHARGRLPENLREEFDQNINNPGQDFKNLKAVITKIDNWTVKNPGVKDTGAQVPTVTTKEEYDKLPKGAEYMEDGKKYRKP